MLPSSLLPSLAAAGPRRRPALAFAFTALVSVLAARSATAQEAPEKAPPVVVPVVDDAMLAPPPDAPRHIATWDDALALIRAQSPDYLSSAQSVERAKAQRRVALAAVLPSLTGQVSYTHQLSTETVTIPTSPPLSFVSPPTDLFTFAGTLSWSVLNLRAIYGVRTADFNIEVARLSFEDRRRLIAQAAVDAMLATLASARVADLNRVGLHAALERLALTQARQQLGQGTALDVDRALGDVESTRGLILQGDESLQRAREALGGALGSPLAIAPPGDLDLEEFEAAVARTCRLNENIERRPDVLAAVGRVDVAERAVHDAELQLAPWLTVSSQASYSTQAVLGPNTLWSLQGSVVVPLYDGGARYGALRDARAAVEQARQALVATRIEAITGTAQARRAVGVLQATRDVARRQRDVAARVDRRTREGYARGLGTSLDLVTSAQALRQAEINLALLDYQVGEARATAVLTNAECVY